MQLLSKEAEYNVRLCSYSKSGNLYSGLFHGWATKDNTTFALVENENGHIEFILPHHILFTDSKEQMKQRENKKLQGGKDRPEVDEKLYAHFCSMLLGSDEEIKEKDMRIACLEKELQKSRDELAAYKNLPWWKKVFDK